MTLDSARTSAVEHPLDRPLEACGRHLVYSSAVSAAINILYLAPTLYMLQVYDRVVPSHGLATLGYLTLLLLITLGTLCALEFLRSRLLIRASVRLERTLTGPLLANMISERGRRGGAQVMRDFDIFRQAVTGAGILAVFDAPWIFVYITLCFLLSPIIGAVVVVGALTLAGLTLATERATRPRLDAANDAATRSYASQAHSVAAADTVNALGMAPAMVRRHQSERSDVVRLQSEASLAAVRYLGFTKFVRLSLQSLALGIAAYLAVDHQISAGAIFAASLLSVRALAPIEQLLGSWKSLVEAHHAYGSLRRLAADTPIAPPRTLLPAPRGRLEADQLTVLRGPGQKPILLGVCLALEPGRVLGLIGASGAGKTTLLRTLVGALRPNQGDVRLDGADICDWPPERLGRHIGYLPQDLSLLPGTVKQNICRFRDALDEDIATLDAKVIAAASSCGAHEMILKLPNGYDTMLGPGGQGVSLGQAQRVALARALFDEPSFVALDEPNAHLDEDGERALLRAMAELKARGASVVVVAHRDSLMAEMDELLFLAEGRVLLRGPRDEVVARLRGAKQVPAAPAAPGPPPEASPERRYA